MNDHNRPPLTVAPGDRARGDLEPLLRGFFREQMPEPWPAWSSPSNDGRMPISRGVPRWITIRRRLAVAASLLLLLLGYLLLAAAFPTSSTRTVVPFENGLGPADNRNPFNKSHRPTPALPAPGGSAAPRQGADAAPPQTLPMPRPGEAPRWARLLR
jgi:hypothetical protein